MFEILEGSLPESALKMDSNIWIFLLWYYETIPKLHKEHNGECGETASTIKRNAAWYTESNFLSAYKFACK